MIIIIIFCPLLNFENGMRDWADWWKDHERSFGMVGHCQYNVRHRILFHYGHYRPLRILEDTANHTNKIKSHYHLLNGMRFALRNLLCHLGSYIMLLSYKPCGNHYSSGGRMLFVFHRNQILYELWKLSVVTECSGWVDS